MTATLNYSFMRTFLANLATSVMERRDQLNELDASCGDGDFGIGMYLGLKNVQRAIEEETSQDIGAFLERSGRAIISSVGGAAGPLFGTLFIEMGRVAKGKTVIELGDLATMFEVSLGRIRLLGKAKAGDKTLVDALEPAVRSLRESTEQKLEMLPALEAAAQAANDGCESTKDLVAKHGKARYLGEQTLSHIDPGAYVIRIIFETLLRTCRSYDS